jgi:cell wall-associated NlpC family hydrolase
VATLWRRPSAPRALDAPALENPARVRAWLDGLSDDARRGLDGRADTQALLGDRVVVTRLTDTWAKVVVPSQPTPLDPRGYPGWVPRRQLTATAPTAAPREATVVARTAWLHRDDSARAAVIEVSIGTRLPVAGREGGWVRVVVPPGRTLLVAAREVSVTAPGAPALPPTGSDLVRTARLFTGLPYLWAGTSGFGVDCSGLTSLDHRVHGVVIPRDAAPQSMGGATVRPSSVAPGDLMFFARSGLVHHVSLYVGDGLMIHAPRTGATVQTIPVTTPAYLAELSGVRRFVG